MAVNVNDKIKKLAPAQRKKVEARAAELIAEEMTLHELRKARKLTQVRMAKTLRLRKIAYRALKKEPTCSFPHSERPSRRWAETCL